MDFTVSPIMYSESIFGILNGLSATNGVTTVTAWEDVVITGGVGTLVGTPVSGTTSASGFDPKGNQSTITLAGQAVTVNTNVPTDGNSIKVVYPISVTGNIMDLNASNMPKAFKIYYHNVFFNPDTNAPYADLYITFVKGVPDGSLALSLSQSKEATNPVKFTLLTLASSTSFGSYVTVPRTGVLCAPVVLPQTSAVHATVITLTYPDNPVWRSSITNLTVNGTTAVGSFTTLAGMIKLASSLTPSAATYTIVITATNFPAVTVSQITT